MAYKACSRCGGRTRRHDRYSGSVRCVVCNHRQSVHGIVGQRKGPLASSFW